MPTCFNFRLAKLHHYNSGKNNFASLLAKFTCKSSVKVLQRLCDKESLCGWDSRSPGVTCIYLTLFFDRTFVSAKQQTAAISVITFTNKI